MEVLDEKAPEYAANLLAERDQLLAALTELVAAYKQVAEGSGDDGADLCRYERAMGAAERLIANTGDAG
jgi:hypothetical protein